MRNFLFFLLISWSLGVFAQPGAGTSVQLDGSSTYLDCGTIDVSGQALTMSAWIKVDQFKTAFPFISSVMGTEEAGTAAAFVRLGDAGLAAERIQFVLRIGAADVKLDGAQSLTAGRWYHIACTYDGAEMRIYINGILDASQAQTGSIVSNDDFFLGRNFDNGRILDGEIEEARLWSAALTEMEIRTWMCQRVTATHPQYASLEGYWRMDDGSGNSATDLSGNGYNASFTGSPQWTTSGAPIGDESVYTYPGGMLSLSHPDGDAITVSNLSGSPTGMHLYRVDSVPNITTPPTGMANLDSSRYWGVFFTGGSSGTYDLDYAFGPNPNAGNPCNLGWATRSDQTVAVWSGQPITNTDFVNSVITVQPSAGGEFIFTESMQGPVSTTMTGTDNLCFGATNGTASVTGIGGLAPYTYQWSSSGNTTDQESNLGAGWVYVTVTDANNCQSTDSILITEPSELTVAVDSVVDATCEGGSDGMIFTVASGGTAPVSFLWDDANMQVTATAVNLEEGTYTVMVTDQNGCTNNVTESVSFVNPAPALDLGGNIDAAGQTFVDLIAPAGMTSYNWSNGGNSSQIRVFSNGTYGVTITDANGCSAEDEVTIVGIPPSSVEEFNTTGVSATVYPNPSSGPVTLELEGFEAGAVNVQLLDLAGRLLIQDQFVVGSNQHREQLEFSNVAAGTYILQVQSEAQRALVRLQVE